MNHPQRSLLSVIVVWVMAILACSPVGGGAATKQTPTSAAVAAEGATPTAATGSEATEVASPTYDAIAAQQTVPPLLTANAATAAAANGTLHQWAAAAQASSQYGDVDWAPTQATGAPNSSTTCGDNKTAWASAGNAGTENLQLAYTKTVVPVAVNIYETNGPGSIVQVDVDEANGIAHTIYSSLPLLTQDCPRIFSIGIVGITAHVNRVKIYFDQSVVKTWDEIDAVELVGNP
jgi:hypothetical protein